jgi:hypothetical protein
MFMEYKPIRPDDCPLLHGFGTLHRARFGAFLRACPLPGRRLENSAIQNGAAANHPHGLGAKSMKIKSNSKFELL